MSVGSKTMPRGRRLQPYKSTPPAKESAPLRRANWLVFSRLEVIAKAAKGLPIEGLWHITPDHESFDPLRWHHQPLNNSDHDQA